MQASLFTPAFGHLLSPLRSLVRFSARLPLLAASASLVLAASAMATTPNFVQGNFAAPATPQTKVTVPFTAAQRVGDLIVVVVGWGDATSHVHSVTDSKGNQYYLTVGPTVLTGSAPLSQALYFAKNIPAALAGANSLTVTFDAAAASPGVRILEYSGINNVVAEDASAAA
jgi:hypothetical protein